MIRFGLRSPRISYRCCRQFHVTVPKRIINPLLPFDVLEEVQEDDKDEQNKTLLKDKKRLIEQKRKIVKKYNEEKDKHEGKAESGNSTVTHDVTEVRGLDWSQSIQREPSGAGNGGSGDGNGNGPPKKDDKDAESKEERERQRREEEEEFDEKLEEEEPKSRFREALEKLGRFLFKCLETIGITLSSVGILGLSGYLYHQFYNRQVLEKMGSAFESGDPAYQLAIHKKTNKRPETDDIEEGVDDLSAFWVNRPQQRLLDDIISGKIKGRYFLVVGEKGTGKTTLIMEAMKKIDGKNVAIFDAHADPEIFRIRLGRALHFAYSEDYIGSLFSMRGPRDTTALLDIERAFNKLETLAIERRMLGKSDKPLIMVINNLHLIKENEEGVKLLELLQQKAESLSGSELVTIVFNSDDYWVYEKLKRLGTRLELINVRDFDRQETVKVLKFLRGKFWPVSKHPEYKLDDARCHKIYDLIGGRPQHIGQVARQKDVIKACNEIIDREKTWFLNQCGLLGHDMDDDVMEFGKFATSAMFLMRAFVEMDRKRMNTLIQSKGDDTQARLHLNHHLPELPLWRARQIMTRPDYIQQYDNLNIFTVDSDSRVRADSVPMMRAFHEIASQPHFDELLENTAERVAAIESLGRTRELVMKDLVHGLRYEVTKKGESFAVSMDNQMVEEDDSLDQMLMEEVSKSEHRKKWWERRMGSFDELYLPREGVAGESKQE